MKKPGSSARLATLARGLGAARLVSMPSRSRSTSAGRSTPRRQTTPSRANFSAMALAGDRASNSVGWLVSMVFVSLGWCGQAELV